MVEKTYEGLKKESDMDVADSTKPLIAVVGPTACGKTKRAVEICRHLHGEILSGDSRQIYRDMSIGTGKDLEEYGEVPYHLIDIRPAGYRYNLHEYVRDFHNALSDIRSRGCQPVLCGGTGLYVETVLSGVRLPEVPENRRLRETLEGKSLEELAEILRSMKSLHNVTDIDTSKRAIRAIEIATYYAENPQEAAKASRDTAQPLDAYIIGLDIAREMRREKISQRLRSRLEEGMIDEVKGLLNDGIPAENLIYYGLEYKFVTEYVTGQLSYEDMYRRLEIAIHQFAKRQMTWFRGMEKRGFKINWHPYDAPLEELLSGF